MVFSDASFLFLFLPLALGIGLGLQRRAFAPAILAISLVFYYWTGGVTTLVLLASIAINYVGGLALQRHRMRSVLTLFVAADLALLAWFKYAGFLATNLDALAGTGLAAILGQIALPIGISFFTFQGISYLVDVYRGDVAAEPNPIVFGAYKAFFPQLIAGPIVRYREVAGDFHEPRIGIDLFAAGTARFAHGLMKKVLIADNVAPIADAAFGLDSGHLTFVGSWLGALAYAVQIYFDFSGYSDMAIGLGAMFGIRIPENFRRPYSSLSLTEFWRRWHMTLTAWFRDYVYIPLGGSRQGIAATYRNLLTVFLLVGLWHGAAWQFVAWGAYNGLFLTFERLAFGDRRNGLRDEGWPAVAAIPIRLLYCAPVVLISWVIFRAADLHQALDILRAMFSPGGRHAFVLQDSIIAAMAPPLHAIALVIGSLVFLMPAKLSLGRTLGRPSPSVAGGIAALAYTAACCVVAAVLVLPGGYSPFLYFRF